MVTELNANIVEENLNITISGWGGEADSSELIINSDIDTGTETVDSFAYSLGNVAFWNYKVIKGDNIRGGSIIVAWNNSGTTITSVDDGHRMSGDIGNTTGVSFAVDISGDNVRLRCTVTSDDWAVWMRRWIL
jgi:hypothetical protein